MEDEQPRHPWLGSFDIDSCNSTLPIGPLLEKISSWQDGLSDQLADLELLRPVHEGIISLRTEIQVLQQEVRSSLNQSGSRQGSPSRFWDETNGEYETQRRPRGRLTIDRRTRAPMPLERSSGKVVLPANRSGVSSTPSPPPSPLNGTHRITGTALKRPEREGAVRPAGADESHNSEILSEAQQALDRDASPLPEPPSLLGASAKLTKQASFAVHPWKQLELLEREGGVRLAAADESQNDEILSEGQQILDRGVSPLADPPSLLRSSAKPVKQTSFADNRAPSSIIDSNELGTGEGAPRDQDCPSQSGPGKRTGSIWKRAAPGFRLPSRRPSSYQGQMSESSGESDSSRGARMCRCQLHPDSVLRALWDFASGIALLFDSIMVPLTIAWAQDFDVSLPVSLATTVFWSGDVVITLSTCYFTKSGELETRRSAILMNYLRRTMVIDMFVCATDWIGIALQAHLAVTDFLSNQDQSGFTVLRIMKVNRVFRLMRVLRVSTLWDKLDLISHRAPDFFAPVQAVVLFLSILWMNHIVCCIWYLIGTNGAKSDTGVGWLDSEVNMLDSTPIEEASMLYQYTIAYHWSISQMTPGSMRITPMNSTECIFNIAMLLFGLLFCTSLISQLSAIMVKLQIAQQERVKVVKQLRAFLRQRGIPSAISQRIERHIVSRLSTRRPLTMKDIPALSHISKPLNTDLKLNMFSAHLLAQPIFMSLDRLSSKVMRVLCDLLEMCVLHVSEELFAKDTVTTTSYVLVSGSVLYVQSTSSEGDGFYEDTPVEVKEKNSWFASAALWTNWTTRGYMEASSLCEVICIDGAVVIPALMNSNSRLESILKQYQLKFCELYQGMHENSNVDDLGEVVDHALVILALPQTIRMEISEPLLEGMRQKNWLRWGSGQELKNLEAELCMGQCALVAAPDGSTLRVVMDIALNVKRCGGEVLIEVAKIEEGTFQFCGRLPGTKLYNKETPQQAATRILQQLMADLQEAGQGMELGELENVDVECSASPTYGLQTQYRRNTFKVSQTRHNYCSPPRLNDDCFVGQMTSSYSFSVTDARKLHTKKSLGSKRFSSILKKIDTGYPLSEAPQMRQTSEASLVEEASIPELLKAHAPYLEDHFPEHIHSSTRAGRTTVYAWVHPDDLYVICQSAEL